MKICLADDHKLIRDGLRYFLEQLGPETTVLEAGSFSEVERILTDNADVDLLLLDLNMPGARGLSGFRALRSEHPQLPIAIVSGSYDRRDINDAFELGAQGFIPKTSGGKTFINAVRLIASGDKYVPEVIFGDRKRASSDVPVGEISDEMQITRREREVLSLIAEGLVNKEIARRLQLREATVKVHIKALFRKLGVRNRTQAAKQAMKLGLIDLQ